MDICMDKEPDGVVVYANSDSCDPNQENVYVLPPLVSVSRDEANGNTELLFTEDNTEVKEYDVKECTNEVPVVKPLEDSKCTLCYNIASLKHMEEKEKKQIWNRVDFFVPLQSQEEEPSVMDISKREGCQVPLTNIGSVVPESSSLRHVCFVLSDSTIALLFFFGWSI
ncbi:uncharacterized protein LOC130505251 [Raphanus sativus]|uniref:Uncharacterized protein LOC130495962 n=1 Tax=Raphanus sativus TaxID=3726 RepID=A0A9W3CW90_RAPSA|nr:uncharacterized protein LOC130495962 [Raphanus sativus]XP_056855835.1 uncharacterized protein LOC130505251 [Raphanus sativus]